MKSNHFSDWKKKNNFLQQLVVSLDVKIFPMSFAINPWSCRKMFSYVDTFSMFMTSVIAFRGTSENRRGWFAFLLPLLWFFKSLSVYLHLIFYFLLFYTSQMQLSYLTWFLVNRYFVFEDHKLLCRLFSFLLFDVIHVFFNWKMTTFQGTPWV